MCLGIFPTPLGYLFYQGEIPCEPHLSPFPRLLYIWLMCPKGENFSLLFDAVLSWATLNTCCSNVQEMHIHSALQAPSVDRALLTKTSSTRE